MNDPIKKYVEQHRKAFDHMEPPAAVLQKLQERLKAQAAAEKKSVIEETEAKKVVPLFSKAKWAIAASVLLAMTAAFFFYNNTTNDQGIDSIAQQLAPKTIDTADSSSVQPLATQKSISNAASPGYEVSINSGVIAKNKIVRKANKVPLQIDPVTKDLYARLGDSSSSSIRLSAILDIEKTNTISKKTLATLAKTLNHDSNSNVRLAALDVMGQYVNNKHVSSLLVSSFTTQKDPLVQLGMIGLLGKIDDVKVEDRLFALADDPSTFEAVKDEAYLALLNQNKL